jgi:hypothetical protein
VLGYIQGVAMQNHAHLPAVQNFTFDGYSWKIKDGDAPNREGRVNDATAGCWVFYFSTSYPINACDRRDPINPKIDPSEIKRGYYVDLVMNATSNGLSGGQEGVYLNPVWVGFVAYGEEIRGGVDANTAFGGAQPAQLPPGASRTPLPGSAPSGAMMGTAPGNPAPAPAAVLTAPNPAGSPLPGPTASPGNAPAPPPHHGFVDNATAPATAQPASAQPLRGPGLPS